MIKKCVDVGHSLKWRLKTCCKSNTFWTRCCSLVSLLPHKQGAEPIIQTFQTADISGWREQAGVLWTHLQTHMHAPREHRLSYKNKEFCTPPGNTHGKWESGNFHVAHSLCTLGGNTFIPPPMTWSRSLETAIVISLTRQLLTPESAWRTVGEAGRQQL